MEEAIPYQACKMCRLFLFDFATTLGLTLTLPRTVAYKIPILRDSPRMIQSRLLLDE